MTAGAGGPAGAGGTAGAGRTAGAAAVADRLLAELAPLDAAAAEALGAEPARYMPLLAPEHFAARHDAKARALSALAGDSREPLALALRERLTADLALDDAGFTTALLAPLATPVHAVLSVFDSVPAGRYDAELALVPGALGDYAETLRTAPRTVAARQVRGAAAQCRKWVDADGAFVSLSGADPRLARAAAGAMRGFADFLTDELLPRAPETDAAGRELYSVTSAAFLGDTIDLDETYSFGWDELAALTDEMRAEARTLGHDSIESAATALDADPRYRLTTDGLVAWLQQRVDETVDAVDGVYVDLPEQAKRPHCVLSPTAVGVMYYDAPDPAFTRPGRVWWAPPSGGEVSSWHEVTTVHHEGVPGHHLQIATALAEPRLHPWQRSMAHVHGYAEGWAHYAERWADELGLLRDPAERLGMLYGQRWRAARIVIDMGLHLGLPMPDGAPWTVERGVRFLQIMAGCDETTARFEVDRYLGWPAQALAFRVGARLWRQLRATAQAGGGFDPRQWHMRALRLGPMGLGPLREVLADDL